MRYQDCHNLENVGLRTRRDSVASGFTLVELLTVVTITATLAAFSLLAMRAAFEQARQAACVSNLRNILVATNLATSDNNNRYPVMRGFSWEPPFDGSGAWIWDALGPYIGPSVGNNLAPVLRCPDAVINPSEGWLQAQGYCSYRYNVYCAQNHIPSTGNAAMLFFDATWNTWVSPQCAHSPGNGAHINVGYVDGSVSSMPFSMFLNLDSGDEASSDFFNLGWTR